MLHFNVTEHPTSAWVAQQIIEAFTDRQTPRYLIRDRDGVYGNEVWSRLKSLAAYFPYCHRSRPHLALEKQCPIELRVMQDGAIVAIAELDGLHHRYERIAA